MNLYQEPRFLVAHLGGSPTRWVIGIFFFIKVSLLQRKKLLGPVRGERICRNNRPFSGLHPKLEPINPY